MICRRCGYDITSCVSPCPECGCAFDAADPSTFSNPRNARTQLVWKLVAILCYCISSVLSQNIVLIRGDGAITLNICLRTVWHEVVSGPHVLHDITVVAFAWWLAQLAAIGALLFWRRLPSILVGAQLVQCGVAVAMIAMSVDDRVDAAMTSVPFFVSTAGCVTVAAALWCVQGARGCGLWRRTCFKPLQVIGCGEPGRMSERLHRDPDGRSQDR